MAWTPDIEEVVGTDERTAQKVRVKKPKMYRVIMFNDDYTSMEFVVEVLMTVFNKSASEATAIMLDIHKKGSGVCGVFTHDIAVSKVKRVHKLARENEFPLRCGIEDA